MDKTSGKSEMSRRDFLEGTGAALAVAAVGGVDAQTSTAAALTNADPTVPRTTIHLAINGVTHDLDVEDSGEKKERQCESAFHEDGAAAASPGLVTSENHAFSSLLP